jgi:hypothetical protein
LPPASAPIQRRIFGQIGQQAQSFVSPYGMVCRKIYDYIKIHLNTLLLYLIWKFAITLNP